MVANLHFQLSRYNQITYLPSFLELYWEILPFHRFVVASLHSVLPDYDV